MQELLGRMRALDPEASEAIRVIACFDELMAGDVSTHGLIAAAAALSAATVGAEVGGRITRVDRRGEIASPAEGSERGAHEGDGVRVWIEGSPGDRRANDGLVLERLSLALRMRRDRAGGTVPRRDLALVLDASATDAERGAAAARLRLARDERYRVVVAPLFAAWTRRANGPDDVVSTAAGTLYVAVIPDGTDLPEGTPVGIGVAAAVKDLTVSFRTALVAARLHDGRSSLASRADDLGGLAVTLADLAQQGEHEDGARIETVAAHPWGVATLDALIRTSSIREAARTLGIHPSTMAARIDSVTAALGFDPLTGLGRTRVGIGFLLWRLQHSVVLDHASSPA